MYKKDISFKSKHMENIFYFFSFIFEKIRRIILGKKVLVFITGGGGSGKEFLYNNFIPPNKFYKLLSMTSRDPRDGEVHNVSYFFTDLETIKNAKKATYLPVPNHKGEAYKAYCVTEKEVFDNIGKNLIYDVNEAKYIDQMIKWFKKNGLDKKYEFKIALLKNPENRAEKMKKRDLSKKDDYEIKVRMRADCEDNISFYNKYNFNPSWHFLSIPGKEQTKKDKKIKKRFILWCKIAA
jgi:guanylate kinase